MEAASTIPNLAAIFEAPARLDRDVITAITSKSMRLTRSDIRYLVDTYYQIQEFRKATANQERASKESTEPFSFVAWVSDAFLLLEKQILRPIDAWSRVEELCQWPRSICGIGPVISAALAAYIDMTTTPSVSALWSFAGVNPEQKWEKGKKRPWSAGLKVLVWKIGDSFMKQAHRDNCSYGKLYVNRKVYEIERNERGEHAELCKREIAERRWRSKVSPTYKAYESGVLPDGRIHLRAQRYAAKMFLSHWWINAYRITYGKEPPKPYAISVLGHQDLLMPEDMT